MLNNLINKRTQKAGQKSIRKTTRRGRNPVHGRALMERTGSESGEWNSIHRKRMG
jgi:hypothetical protein